MEIEKQLACKYGISKDEIHRIYKAYWFCIRNYIDNLPIKTIDERDFNSINTSINIPLIGKLGIGYDRFKALRNKYNIDKKNGKNN